MPVHDVPDDDKLDETIEETFPASDPPANTPETGIRLGTPFVPEPGAVSDNPARSRFELTVDGQTAYLAYERTNDWLSLVHTEVPPELRGRHLGDRLVEAGVSAARANGLQLAVVCPFAQAYMRRHHSDTSFETE
jgi:predicted GNAT family acetyltransferase